MSYHTIDILIESNGTLSANHSYDDAGKTQFKRIDVAEPDNQIKASNRRIIEILINILKEARLRDTEEYELLGSLLYNTLLDNNIGRTLLALKNDRSVSKIKIELMFNGAENIYAHWPWEYLFCPTEKNESEPGYFLSTHSKIIMSRPVKAEMQQLQEPLCIMLVAPGPSTSGDPQQFAERKKVFGQQPLAYENLFENVTTILKKNEQISVHQLVGTEKMTELGEKQYVLTVDEFEERVQKIRPHIIHFLGHGRVNEETGEGQVAFTDIYGKVNWVSDAQFAGIIKAVQPKFVFLQACETAAMAPYKAISGVARQLTGSDGLPAVIAMQCKINQDSSIDFAKSFYEKLSKTGLIGDAVQAGRQTILNATRSVEDREKKQRDFAFGIPVLYVKDSTPLFSIREDQATDPGGKNNPTSISEVVITCYGGQKKHTVPINIKFCPQGCGEFVDRPIPNCVNGQCPQKLLKTHRVCVMCGEKNIYFQEQ